MGKLAMVICLASLALGQEAERVFHLTNAITVMSRQEIATTLRTVANISQLSLGNAAPSLTVKGTPDQIALAEWLVPRLDVSESTNPGPQEYRVAGNADDVLVVYGLGHITTPRGIQEVVTTVRSVADIAKIFTMTPARIITLRGNASQIGLAQFLLQELDQPLQPRQNPTLREYKAPDSIDVTAVIYGLAHTEDPRSIQELLTSLRAVLDIQKLFSVLAPRLVAIRGSASQMQMAEWLLPLLDRETPSLTGNEAPMPGGNDDVVHVFYLPPATSSEQLNALLKEMHSTVHIMKAFVRTAPPALVLRGRADQIAMAAKTIELADHAKP